MTERRPERGFSAPPPPRRRGLARLDPDQRKYLKILLVMLILAYPAWVVGKAKCNAQVAGGGGAVTATLTPAPPASPRSP